MQRILGIEGGGSKTEWLLVDESGSTRSGRLPAANLRLISDDALDRLLRVLPEAPTRVGIFLAGCVTETDRARLLACTRRVWPEAILAVGSDRQSGFAAAFQDRDGIAVIAGTGSAITGRAGDRQEKAGGWGQLLGDKGSGYDLAVQALRHVLWAFDLTRTVSPAARELLRTLALNRLEDLVNWARDADKMSVAMLAPVVFSAAAGGDPAMTAILEGGARALADGACAVALRLGFSAPEVQLQGGLFVHHPAYVERFQHRIAERLPCAKVVVCMEAGTVGAVWLAGHQEPGGNRLPPMEAIPGGAESELALELAAALTEQVNPRSVGLDTMSAPRLVELFIDEEAEVTRALAGARVPLAAGIELVVNSLRGGGRLFYVGAGTSGRLGVLDASEIPPTFGMEPDRVQAIIAGGFTALHRAVEGAEDETEAGALGVLERGVNRGDVVCGITASGQTPFVMGALTQARALEARTILLSCNAARRRSGPAWDVEIDLGTGPELLSGSTRLKAGTATKCALNILSTGAMVRLGRTEGNLMAGLMVSNAKLRERAVRMVASLCAMSREDARLALESHDWNVRLCLGRAHLKH